MEQRKRNVIFNKVGGTASKNATAAKISLPKEWLDKMQITPGEREVILEFNEEKIIIKKSSNE